VEGGEACSVLGIACIGEPFIVLKVRRLPGAIEKVMLDHDPDESEKEEEGD
jgi:hypothetical protein